MQSELKLGSIGQIARTVDNLERAQAWFKDVLGLPHLYTYGKLAFFDCGGTRLMLEAIVRIATRGRRFRRRLAPSCRPSRCSRRTGRGCREAARRVYWSETGRLA